MKRFPEQPTRYSGFTLLEALIALIVLATGLLALAQFHAAALLNSANAKALSQAAGLAHSKMDDLRTRAGYHLASFRDLPSKDSASAETKTNATSGSDLAVSNMDWVGDFHRYWSIDGEYIAPYQCNGSLQSCDTPPCSCNPGATPCTNLATTSSCHQKRIQVSVEWEDAHGTQQRVDLESIIPYVDPTYAGLALSPGS